MSEECANCQRLEKELAEWRELAQHWRRKYGESERARAAGQTRAGR